MTKECKDLSSVHLEIDPIDCIEVSEGLLEALNIQNLLVFFLRQQLRVGYRLEVLAVSIIIFNCDLRTLRVRDLVVF